MNQKGIYLRGAKKVKNYDIGILTLWNVPNYGTFVQAYALQKIIERLSGREVVQIAHLDDHHFNFYYNYKKYLQDYGIFSKQFIKSIFIKNIEDYDRFNCFKNAYNIVPHTDCITKENISHFSFNKVFLGSDIIWDYSLEPFNKDQMLFGLGIKGEINSYAASFGTIKVGDDYPEYIVNGLRRMKHISVRDHKSADIVNQITGKTPTIVLDPTWLWEFNHDKNIVEPETDNYILVYGQNFTRKFIENLLLFADDNKKKIIALDCNADNYEWCDVLIHQSELHPFEWVGYFKKADFVATSTFHGISFSLIFNKKFAFCKTDFIMAKAEVLLKELNLLHIFENKEDVQGMLSREWDYDYINRIIKDKKKQSIKFLERAIGENYE